MTTTATKNYPHLKHKRTHYLSISWPPTEKFDQISRIEAQNNIGIEPIKPKAISVLPDRIILNRSLPQFLLILLICPQRLNLNLGPKDQFLFNPLPFPFLTSVNSHGISKWCS